MSGTARAFKKLPADTRSRLTGALEKPATDVAQQGRIVGKAVKAIVGPGDSFHRLRAGNHRIMYDVIEKDRVILVLGIVHCGDLERWLRNR